jgi:hypothetical protein
MEGRIPFDLIDMSSLGVFEEENGVVESFYLDLGVDSPLDSGQVFGIGKACKKETSTRWVTKVSVDTAVQGRTLSRHLR